MSSTNRRYNQNFIELANKSHIASRAWRTAPRRGWTSPLKSWGPKGFINAHEGNWHRFQARRLTLNWIRRNGSVDKSCTGDTLAHTQKRYSYQAGNTIHFWILLRKRSIQCSTAVLSIRFQMVWEMFGYPSILRSVVITAENVIASELQFNHDAKATSAKDIKLNYPGRPSAKYVIVKASISVVRRRGYLRLQPRAVRKKCKSKGMLRRYPGKTLPKLLPHGVCKRREIEKDRGNAVRERY